MHANLCFRYHYNLDFGLRVRACEYRGFLHILKELTG